MILLNKEWYCDIRIEESNRAFYAPLLDYIVCPKKEQFIEGEAFYSTLLHEVAHSTGHKERLSRTFGTSMKTDTYAVEELTAELTSAIVGNVLSIAVALREENALYLRSWLSFLNPNSALLGSLF